MSDEIEGFYTAHMTGAEGAGFSMFVFCRGRIVGVDPMGVKFDGFYEAIPSGGHVGRISVEVPPGGETIQGVKAGPSGLTYSVDVSLPKDFSKHQFLAVATPLGPVNVNLKRVRDVDF